MLLNKSRAVRSGGKLDKAARLVCFPDDFGFNCFNGEVKLVFLITTIQGVCREYKNLGYRNDGTDVCGLLGSFECGDSGGVSGGATCESFGG